MREAARWLQAKRDKESERQTAEAKTASDAALEMFYKADSNLLKARADAKAKKQAELDAAVAKFKSEQAYKAAHEK